MNLPALHGNWVDLVIILFIGVYVLANWPEGFLSLTARMINFLGSFAVALRLYPLAGQLFTENFSFSPGIANALGFVAIAFFAEIILGFLLNMVYRRIPEKLFTSLWNRLLGVFPAFIDAVVVTAFFVILVIGLPFPGALKAAVAQSKLGGALATQSGRVEKTIAGILGGAAQDTISFLTVNPGGSENINLHFRTTEVTVDSSSESEMLNLVNHERTSRGIPALQFDVKLRDVARAHSRDMFARGYFSHIDPDGKSPFDRMQAAGISFTEAGENIAYAPTTILAHNGLMDSPGHRENILNPNFHKIGIGIIDGGIYGKMFTQDFTN